MTTTYQTMSGDAVTAAGGDLAKLDPDEFLTGTTWTPGALGVIRLVDGVPVELIGTDGGEPEDQTLSRSWGWVTGALNDAYGAGRSDGHNAGLNQVNDGHVDTLNRITEAAPESWDGEDAIDSIAIDYVRHLVAEVRRLGGHLEPRDPETGEPWADTSPPAYSTRPAAADRDENLELLGRLDALIERNARAMYDDESGSSEQAAAYRDVAELFGLEPPGKRLDRLYDAGAGE